MTTGDEFDDDLIRDLDDPVIPDPLVSEEKAYDDQGRDFTPTEIVAGERLKTFSIASRLMALYRVVTGATIGFVSEPMERWPVKEIIRYAAVIQPLGIANVGADKVGRVDVAQILTMQGNTSAEIKASLVSRAVAATISITDTTLLDELVKIRGVKLNSTGCSPNRCRVEVPGYPGEILVSYGTAEHSKIVKGGEDFVVWHNGVFGTRFAYQIISRCARIHTRFYLTLKKFSVDPQTKVPKFEERPPVGGKIAKFPPPPERFLGIIGPVERNFARALGNPKNVPSLGSAKDPQNYMEWVLTRAYADLSPDSRARVESYADEIFAWSKSETEKATGEALKLSIQTVAGSVMPGTNLRAVCNGDAWKYVEASRQQFRSDDNDLSRKSDAPAFAGSMGTASSVAYKTSVALDALVVLGGEEILAKSVDAYGVHEKNWWHQEVVRVFSPDKVVWLDIDNKYLPPPLSGRHKQRDVTQIPMGSGRGRIILDDTFPVAGKEGRTVFGDKLHSIVGADYDGGMIKMYLGADSDCDTPLGNLSNSVEAFLTQYPRVVFTPGGSAHTQEYFMVFSRGKDGQTWHYPERLSLPFHGPTEGIHDPDSHNAKARVFLRSWLRGKCVDMFVSNMYINGQVGTGCALGPLDPKHFRTQRYCPPVLYIGGSGPNKAIVSKDIPVAPVPKTEEKFIDW